MCSTRGTCSCCPCAFRVMNVIARLLLRTRGYASGFFIIATATVFFLNVNRQEGQQPE